MKKNLLYISIILISLSFFYSCEKETEGVSSILYFELFEGENYLLPLNNVYKEPGYKVIYAGEDITNTVKVEGEVDGNTVGVYPINYSIVNADGVKTTRTRTVIVADPSITTDISGEYITVEGTRREAAAITPYPGFKVSIRKIAPGFFEVSDLLGGYYDQRAKYGSLYAAKGQFQLKEDNTLALLSSHVPGWGDSLSDLRDAVYNPEDGSIKWTAYYAGMKFFIVLNKK